MFARLDITSDKNQLKEWVDFYGKRTKEFLGEIDNVIAKLTELNESPLAGNAQLTREYKNNATLITQFISAIEILTYPLPTHLPPHLLMQDPVVAQRTIARNRIAQFAQINQTTSIFNSLNSNLKDILNLYLKPTVDGNKLNLTEQDRQMLTSARHGYFELDLVEKMSSTLGSIEISEGVQISDREYRQADIGAEDADLRSGLFGHLFKSDQKLDKETQVLLGKLREYKNSLADIEPSFMSELKGQRPAISYR